MSFQDPSVLFLLVVPLLLALAAVRHEGAPVAAPVSPRALRPRRRLARLLAATALIPPALLAVVICLLARPVRHEEVGGRVPKTVTNIQFCLNVSNSMLARRIGMHCRYCASAAAVGEFARGREGDAFGLTLFGTTPIIWVPLSDDVSALYRASQLCYPDYMPGQVSRYADTEAGIRLSVDQLTQRSRGSGGRLLILLTDGEDPALARHADELAELMNREGVSLHVLLFQNPGSSPVLASMARRTEGGGLHDCSSSQELGEVFRMIDNMKKMEYEVRTPEPVPDNGTWLWAVAVLAALYLLGLFGLRYTPW